MGADLTVPVGTVPAGGGILNIRAGAVIMKNGRILMVTSGDEGYFYSVGGRVRFGETAKEAAEREVFEETGVHIRAERLAFVHENLFMGDAGAAKGKPVYEIAFYYIMDVPEDFVPICKSVNCGGENERLEWISPDDERTIYPDFFRTELKDISDGVKHFVTNELSDKVSCPEKSPKP